jgi:hypothetical protein
MGSLLIKRAAWATLWIVILAQPTEGAPFTAFSGL